MNVITLKEIKTRYELLETQGISLEQFIRNNYINVYDTSFKFIGYELRSDVPDYYRGVF